MQLYGNSFPTEPTRRSFFQIYMHSFPDEGTFPHYEMAVDADDDTASAVMLDKKGAGTFKKSEKIN